MIDQSYQFSSPEVGNESKWQQEEARQDCPGPADVGAANTTGVINTGTDTSAVYYDNAPMVLIVELAHNKQIVGSCVMP